jgi:hypothetical protein
MRAGYCAEFLVELANGVLLGKIATYLLQLILQLLHALTLLIESASELLIGAG